MFGERLVSLGRHSSSIATHLTHTMIAAQLTHAPSTLFGLGQFDGAQPLALCWDDLLLHRDYLIRFAKRKLQDPALAEDLVHDVFEAVITGRASFCGRSALRSWLTAVLKNKIVDVIRQRVRYDSLDSAGVDDEVAEMSSDWAGPDTLAEQRQRLEHTLQRIDVLPQGLRDVMQFRVLQDESSEEVCERLNITESSLFVRLHRARKQLLC
jgi:RNA polymerase sigma-70 factor, ECF subfamily